MDYKQLKFALDHDEIVVFQRESRDFIAIGYKKDCGGDYRDSGWYSTKEDALQNIGDCYGFEEKSLKDLLPNWTFIDSIPPKLATVHVGTKVKILDCAEEDCRWLGLGWDNFKQEEMVGSICEIQEIDGSDYYIWNEDKSVSWAFPRSAFTVLLEEETTEEMTVEEICKELGRNIKIIK